MLRICRTFAADFFERMTPMPDLNYNAAQAHFGARLFLFVAGMPRTTRRLFNRFLFREAKEMADGRDRQCKKALIAQLYNYFDGEVVTDFLFSGRNVEALEAHRRLPFDQFFEQYGSAIDIEWNNKTFDTFDSPTLFDDNPEARKELDIGNYERLFALAQRLGGAKEPPDFGKIGYLAFFYKSDLTEEDFAMVDRMYCQGELLYDMFDFVASEELTTAVRKRAADALAEYCVDCGDEAFVRGVKRLADEYRQMNPHRLLPFEPDLAALAESIPSSDEKIRLLPRQCLHGCRREEFVRALEEVMTDRGMIDAGSGRLESLFEGTTEPLQPVVWKRKSYEFAYFLRALCPFVERKEELAAALFYYRAVGNRFKVSSLKSPRCSDEEAVKSEMEQALAEARRKAC